jgi:hypothetical protein
MSDPVAIETAAIQGLILGNYRHLKSGHIYAVTGIVLLEATLTPLVVYHGANNVTWARPFDEFMDGRFVLIQKNSDEGISVFKDRHGYVATAASRPGHIAYGATAEEASQILRDSFIADDRGRSIIAKAKIRGGDTKATT